VPSDPNTELFAQQRQAMVDAQVQARGISDSRVLTAMRRVPRHEFVALELQQHAYADHPVAIGEGQTISQPLIVAIMLLALDLAGNETVLEIGTGSGYQTALLAELAREVYTIERHASLARSAQSVLCRLGCDNVTVRVGDGSLGFPEKAPFDAIVVSAAAPRLPPLLLEQLREGGRMVVPVGGSDSQELQLVRKQDKEMIVTPICACRFVPLIASES